MLNRQNAIRQENEKRFKNQIAKQYQEPDCELCGDTGTLHFDDWQYDGHYSRLEICDCQKGK